MRDPFKKFKRGIFLSVADQVFEIITHLPPSIGTVVSRPIFNFTIFFILNNVVKACPVLISNRPSLGVNVDQEAQQGPDGVVLR